MYTSTHSVDSYSVSDAAQCRMPVATRRSRNFIVALVALRTTPMNLHTCTCDVKRGAAHNVVFGPYLAI